MNKEQLFLEIDEIYSEWHGGDLHIGKERENLIKQVIEKAINNTGCCEEVCDCEFERIDSRRIQCVKCEMIQVRD